MTIDTDSQTFTIEVFSDPTLNKNMRMEPLLQTSQAQNTNTTKKVVRRMRKNSKSLINTKWKTIYYFYDPGYQLAYLSHHS